MPKTNYIIDSNAGFSGQLNTTDTAIGGYSGTLTVTPAKCITLTADNLCFANSLDREAVLKASYHQQVEWTRILRTGDAPPATGAPADPVMPAAVPQVEPGIEPRYRSLCGEMKGSDGYNDGIGLVLGIVGHEKTIVDLTAVAPDFELKIIGGLMQVIWGWGGFAGQLDMIELVIDRNDGKGDVLLAYDTTPGYTDTTPFPAVATKWTVKAIYRVGDRRVGQWSEKSLNVGG